MKKQPEITEATRNTFVEVFCEFYNEKPIGKITVKALVQRAGYSRATFYNYFKDPYDLLDYVENEFISSLLEAITHNIGKQQSLDSFVHDFAAIIESKNTYINVFMNSANSPSFVSKLKKEALPLLLSAFGIDADNFSARCALEFYISGLIPVLGSWLRNNQDVSAEELAVLIKGILQDGILKQLK